MDIFDKIERGETTEIDAREIRKVVGKSYFFTFLIGLGAGVCVTFCLVMLVLVKSF